MSVSSLAASHSSAAESRSRNRQALACRRRIVAGQDASIGSLQGPPDDVPLPDAGHRDQRGAGREQGGNGQGDGPGRHLRQGAELPVVHLLLPAGRIQLSDDLDPQGVLEIRNARIVEGQMAVLPDSQESQIEGVLPQQPGIALALRRRVRRAAVQIEHPVERQPVEEPVFEVAPEGLGRAGRQAEVFVHVEGVDRAPSRCPAPVAGLPGFAPATGRLRTAGSGAAAVPAASPGSGPPPPAPPPVPGPRGPQRP